MELEDLSIVEKAAMLSGEDDPGRALLRLHNASRDVVLTRGGDGLMVMTRDGRRIDMAALPVKLVSSHGAGDCFCGALAARMAAGDNLEAACRFANEAAGGVRLARPPRGPAPPRRAPPPGSFRWGDGIHLSKITPMVNRKQP